MRLNIERLARQCEDMPFHTESLLKGLTAEQLHMVVDNINSNDAYPIKWVVNEKDLTITKNGNKVPTQQDLENRAFLKAQREMEEKRQEHEDTSSGVYSSVDYGCGGYMGNGK